MSYETLQVEQHEDIGIVTLNRPTALNALNVRMGQEFTAAVRELIGAKVRAVLLTGAGRAFCAGGDLREMQTIAAQEKRAEAFFDEPLRVINECILLIRQSPLPFIAAVNGVASGGGCNLALACDFVLAASSARFNQAFIKVGLTPDCGGTFILPRLIGWRRATELLMTGDIVEAREALEMGMINSIHSDGELIEQALNLAKRLARGPTAAIGRIKELLEAGATNGYADQLELERQVQIKTGQTADALEGIAAFVEKRSPRFAGK